jgi:hypothetical protein
MIEFKKNVNKVLPYDRKQYFDFFDDEFDSSNESIKWYGVSFQDESAGRKISLTEFIEMFESLFKNIILKLDNGSFWIVNHDDKNIIWFPNDEDTLVPLRTLFKQRNVPNTFRGALIFTKDDLLKFSRDLISYPCALFYKKDTLYRDLDVSHGELQFIIKISGHKCIDFLSTDKELIRKVVNENSSSLFIVKEYRGTSL